MNTTTAFQLRLRVSEQIGAYSDALDALVDYVVAYATLDEQLLKYAASIQNNLDRVIRYVESDYHVNSLGEIQGAALDLDRTCALREAAAAQVIRFANQIVRLNQATHDHVAAVLEGTPFARGEENR